MADLEQHAFKRDRRFLVRLVVMIALAGVAGTLIGGRLTSKDAAGCAADAALDDTPAVPGGERSQPGE